MVLSFPDGCTLAGSLSFIWYLSHDIKVLLIPSLWSLVTSVHHNLGYGPVIAVPVIRLIVYLLRSHAFPFQGLPWKGWVFRSASSCPLRLLGPGHGIRSFGCHPSRKFFLRVEFIATLFPARVQMLAFSARKQGRGQSILSFNFGKTAGYGAPGKCSHRCINLFKNSWESNPLSNKTKHRQCILEESLYWLHLSPRSRLPDHPSLCACEIQVVFSFF